MSLLYDIWVRVFYPRIRPERSGPHAVGTTRLNVRVKGERQRVRVIAVQLWYPAEAYGSALQGLGLSWLARLRYPTWAPARHGAPPKRFNAACPLIAYVPDAHGRHDDNTHTLANLASHGFILAAIDNPYRNGPADVHPAGEVAWTKTNGVADQIAVPSSHRIARGVETVSSLLDALQALEPGSPESAWADRLDLKQVGILGYAMGGAVAVETAHADRRFVVAANLDGAMSADARMVKIPYLLMLSDFSMPAASLPAAAWEEGAEQPSRLGDYRRAQAQAALAESHVIEVAGTRREHFSDRLIFPSRLIAGCRQIAGCKRIRAIIDAYTVAFFTTYLHRDPHPLMCVRHSPYPEVRFVSVPEANDAWAVREPAGRG